MNWIEVKLSVDGEAAEAIAEILQRYGHQGVSIEREGEMPEMYGDDPVPPADRLLVRAYLPVDGNLEQAKAQLETALGHMNMMYPMPTPVYSPVNETDWAEAWKVHYQPVRIGKRILIRPAWVELEAKPHDVVISLDPGMAFGTGTHPTTQLCLEALESLLEPGTRVLDLGTGSGILAIAAAKLGAAEVLGLDNDSVAVEAAAENIIENGTADKVTIQHGSLENVITSSRRFDLIVVNILARIIIEMCKDGLGQTVRPGGKAILSGIIETQADDVENALRATGLNPTRRRGQGDWVVIEAQRPIE